MKRVLFIALALALAICLTLFMVSFSAFADDKIVDDGLVAYYDGVKNTESGHNADSLIWYDLAGDNDVTVVQNDTCYFTDSAYHLKAAQFNFPKALLDTVNSNEFSVELKLGSLEKIGSSFATFINNSGNDNFSLFLRVAGNYIEFKCASNDRVKVADGLEYFTDSTVCVTYKVGGKCSVYVDGVLLGQTPANTAIGATGDLFFGHAGSTKQHEADYEAMRFYNRELSADEVITNAKADGNYDTTVKVVPFENAQSKTNIFGDIALCEYVDSAAKLNSFKDAAFYPSTAIFHYAGNEKVSTADYSEEFASLDEVFTILENKMIPVFYLKDNAAADSLCAYLEKNDLIDVSIMSDNAETVLYARKKCNFLRGIIDYKSLSGKTLDTDELLDIRRNNASHYAKIACLPSSAATAEAVKYLNSRQITVWISSELENETKANSVTMAVNGAYGIISSDAKLVYDSLSEYITANSMTRPAAIIGHRGLPSAYPENTLESAIAAYNAGADIIELDIYLTKDKEIVINHDSTTTKYNKVISVESSTLAQLKELDYNGSKLPTLREFFEEFNGKDVMFFIEIKSSSMLIVPELKKLVEEYDIYGQCAVITYERTGQLTYMRNFYPEMPVSLLADSYGGISTFPEILDNVGRYNSSYSPDKGGCNADYIRATLLRGITSWPYTFNDLATECTYIAYGHAGITTNYANYTSKMADEIKITSSIKPSYSIGDSVALTSSASLKNRTFETITPEYIILDGAENATLQNGSLKFTKNGSVTVMAKYATKIGSMSYTLYSEPVVLTAGEALPTETEAPETTAAPSKTVAPETTVALATTTAQPTDTAVPATATAQPTDTTTPETETAKPTETTTPAADEKTENNNTWLIIAIVAGVIVIGGAVFFILKRKKA